jgi:hypothetical protein
LKIFINFNLILCRVEGELQNVYNADVKSIPFRRCRASFKDLKINATQMCTERVPAVKHPEFPGAVLFYTVTDRRYAIAFFASDMDYELAEPAVYTRIAYYIKWISEATGGEALCSRFF